jgi:ELWxxDGT repeat protein
LYFTANVGDGLRWWRSGGTGAGTAESRIQVAGSDAPLDAGLIASAGGWAVFLWHQEGAAGWQLWRTDGTPAGTYLLREFAPNAEPGSRRLINRSVFLWLEQDVAGANKPPSISRDFPPPGARVPRRAGGISPLMPV